MDALHERLAELREARGPRPDPRTELRELVLVLSSSRGGSSVFSEALREVPGLLHLRAEINPFLRLAGYGWPELPESDALSRPDEGDADLFAAELAYDIGQRAAEQADFALDLDWRLAVQWPGRLPRAVVTGDHVENLRRLGLDPAWYDLPWGGTGPAGPPGELVLEEPPFVAIRPWRRATAQQMRSLPLVVKTPSNAYRLPLYRALFPQARIRAIHLTRNPAGAINGLYDGWRFHGFHSHRVPEPMAIAGYTDHRPLDRHWWKYDLPPGWRGYTSAPLPEVCAFQWRSAHEAILGLEDVDVHRLRFEDFVRDGESRVAALDGLLAWLGVPFDPGARARLAQPLPKVMTTARPRIRRWFARRELLEPVLRRPEITGLAEALGYGPPETWE